MEKYDFKIIYQEGRLIAEVTIRGRAHHIDVTNYFEEDKAVEEWLWFRRIKRLKNDSS